MKSSYSVMLPHLMATEKDTQLPDASTVSPKPTFPDLNDREIAELLPELLNSFAPKMDDPTPQSS